jgi:hypothetical protein
MAWSAALVYQAHRSDTLRNQTMRQTVMQLLGLSEEEYTSAQASYDMRRLRLKGLIERIPHTHRYRLTELGAKVSTFLIKLYERLFRPGLAASLPLPTCPSELAQSLEAVAVLIDRQLQEAFFLPATAPS